MEDIIVRKKPPIPRCPRCRSKRLSERLDGSRVCRICGQRIASDGGLIPSADKRPEKPTGPEQLFIL